MRSDRASFGAMFEDYSKDVRAIDTNRYVEKFCSTGQYSEHPAHEQFQPSGSDAFLAGQGPESKEALSFRMEYLGP